MGQQSQHPIHTESATTQATTFHQGTETVRAWLGRHRTDLDGPLFVEGEELCTTWSVALNQERQKCTNRGADQSDTAFKNDHINAVATDMANFPPIV